MEHKQWQDHIPFYIAQTLNTEQKQAFEHHLTTCASCQSEIADWRTIASAVWSDADAVARSLPPLSQEVYNRLQYRNQTPASRYAANPPRPSYAQTAATQGLPRRRNARGNKNSFIVPVTLVAGFVATIVFGGLLILLALNLPARDSDTDSGTIDIAQNLTPNDATVESDFAAPETQFESTPTTDPFEVVIIPTITPTLQSAQLPATSTQRPAQLPATNRPSLPVEPVDTFPQGQVEAGSGGAGGIGGGNPNMNPASSSMAMAAQSAEGAVGPFITLTPNQTDSGAHECYLFNPTPEGLTLYSATSYDADVAGILQPNDEYRTLVRSNNGWYEIAFEVRQGRYLIAWMPPETAYLRGNCRDDVFWIPTPTQSVSLPQVQAQPSPTLIRVTDGTVATINKAFADLYQNANFTNPVEIASQGEAFTVVGSSGAGNDQFIQVRYNNGRLLWLWAGDVTISNR